MGDFSFGSAIETFIVMSLCLGLAGVLIAGVIGVMFLVKAFAKKEDVG